MCQSNLISEKIVNLSTRSFIQRLHAVSTEGLSVFKMARLNKDLDKFYDLLISQYPTVTEKDYSLFGSQFNILLEKMLMI